MFRANELGDLIHCGTESIWIDCPVHGETCYVVACTICNTAEYDCEENSNA